MFRPRFGLQGTKTLEELEYWADDGLIPAFKDSDMIDVTLAHVLKAIREHLNGSS